MTQLRINTNKPISVLARNIAKAVQDTQAEQSKLLLKRFQRTGQFPKEEYLTVVNKTSYKNERAGLRAVNNVQVGNPVLFLRELFNAQVIAREVVRELVRQSPTLTRGIKNRRSYPGTYRRSFRANYNRRLVVPNLITSAIPAQLERGDQLLITNIAPYATKLENQNRRKRNPNVKTRPKTRFIFKGPFSRAIKRLQPRFPDAKFTLIFIPLAELGRTLKTGKRKGSQYVYPAIRISKKFIKFPKA